MRGLRSRAFRLLRGSLAAVLCAREPQPQLQLSESQRRGVGGGDVGEEGVPEMEFPEPTPTIGAALRGLLQLVLGLSLGLGLG